MCRFAKGLERELAEAREQRDEALSDLEFRRELYVILAERCDRRTVELAETRDQRDRLERELATALRDRDNALSDWTQADTDTIRALHERNEAIEQRDRLALICGELIAAVRINSMRDTFCEATHEQIEIWLKQWVDKLAAAKGGTPNNCQRPELCLLTETCRPCAICPNAVEGILPLENSHAHPPQVG
jgi:hypothetical protein